MIKAYTIIAFSLLALAIVDIIYMIVSSSKRFTVTESSKMAGGVVFKHKDRGLLSLVWNSIAFILTTSGLLMSKIGRSKSNADAWSNAKKADIFLWIALGLYALIFISALVQFLKYREFRLCPQCFYLGGTKYDRKKYTYSLDGEEVVFRSGRTEKRITVPEKKRKEVLSILGKYYTKSENG